MLKKFLYFTLAMVSFLYLANKDEIDRYNLRTQMTEATVLLINPQVGGGTGFAFETPSGQKFILTNDHICELADANGTIYASEQEQLIPLKVMHRSPYTDLCLISPLLFKTPLKLANNYYVGQKVYITGHPHLLDDTMTDGEIIQEKNISVPVKFFADKESCEVAPKFSFAVVPIFIFQVPVCFLNVNALLTTAPILPGNSGSPVVNKNGKLVGVAFASSDEEYGRAYTIPLGDIYNFVKNY